MKIYRDPLAKKTSHAFTFYPKSRSLVILLRQGFTKFFTFTKRFY